jgi:hypothetical protein
VRYVPYDVDFGETLWRARREAFLAGDYSAPNGISGNEAGAMSDGDVQASMAEFLGVDVADLEEFENMVPEGTQSPAPRDDLDERIARMLTMTMDQGSHSILDVVQVGEWPGIGVVTPVPEAELQELVGTSRPTHPQVAATEAALMERCPRWEGRLVVVHDDQGNPDELCFLGVTGD